jgi:hypothetical protein
MDVAQLQPLAEILVESYLTTISYSRQFLDEHHQPPSIIAKAQHMRSIAQAMVNGHDQLELHADYAEFGKLQVTDLLSDRTYLVRSNSALTIEAAMQGTLFDPATYITSPVVLLVYKFHEQGMDLSVAGTRLEPGRKRLQATGLPNYVGTWSYSSSSPSATFDQGNRDLFEDLGDEGDRDEGDGAE